MRIWEMLSSGSGEIFIVWWSDMIKHITVFRGWKGATLMLCPVLII